MHIRPQRIAACLIALALVSAAAGAQSGSIELNKQKEALRERNRSTMHPGDALVVVGNEQGDNDIRAKTPILAQGAHAPELVDTERAYRSKLALYETGVRTPAPLIVVREASTSTRQHTTTPATDEAVGTKVVKRGLVQLLVGAAITVAICWWGYRRFGGLDDRVESHP